MEKREEIVKPLNSSILFPLFIMCMDGDGDAGGCDITGECPHGFLRFPGFLCSLHV